ncbi:MAG TPA: hypothetical protein VF598_05310, partial [Hymenobacter sp.]
MWFSFFTLWLRAWLLVLLCAVSFHSRAQYFVNASSAPCPHGDPVKADTIFYSPTKAFPFDRCFHLSYTLPGRVTVTHFSILPVDQQGNPKIRRRDRRVFLRSGWRAGKGRRDARRANKFEDFRKGLTTRLFTRIDSVVKAGRTELILEVPPLDPGREYQITLFAKDYDAAANLLEVGRLVFQSQQVTPPAPVASLRGEARILHRHNVAKRGRGAGTENFARFEQALYATPLEFNGPEQSMTPYKVFLTPENVTLPALEQLPLLDPPHYYLAQFR